MYCLVYPTPTLSPTDLFILFYFIYLFICSISFNSIVTLARKDVDIRLSVSNKLVFLSRSKVERDFDYCTVLLFIEQLELGDFVFPVLAKD